MSTRHQQKAGPSFPQQRRGRRANVNSLPKSPLASNDDKQREELDKGQFEARKNSTTDEEDSNIFIDVTNVDSDNDDSTPKSTPDENECEKQKELIEGEKAEKVTELVENDTNQLQN